MSNDETTNETVEPAGQEATENPSSDTKTPEFYEKELERARKEAARYRERARETAEETATQMREEFATREGELTKRIDELTEQHGTALNDADLAKRTNLKLRLALVNEIPKDKIDDFTKRLQGETDEELTEDAKSLAELFVPSVTEDHTQGLGTDVPLNNPTILSGLQKFVNKGR